MIEIAISYDPTTKEYRAYEPTTDTLFVTTSLGDSFLKLDEFLKARGLITEDILKCLNVTYHIDSYVFFGLIENNVNLMKRLNQAPSGFTVSGQRFGVSQSQPSLSTQLAQKKKSSGGGKRFGGKSTGTFSKSSFGNSYKKFGGNNY